MDRGRHFTIIRSEDECKETKRGTASKDGNADPK